ncbi:MAG: hypothetical protein U0R69_14470 [Gaiellales bacterium]
MAGAADETGRGRARRLEPGSPAAPPRPGRELEALLIVTRAPGGGLLRAPEPVA